MLIRITGGALDIPRRLREIDPQFFLVLNTDTQMYEVHHAGQVGGTLALNLPFDEVDSRIIDYVRAHDVKYAKKIFADMDRKNDALERELTRLKWDEADQKTKELHRYVRNHESTETMPDDAYTNRWI